MATTTTHHVIRTIKQRGLLKCTDQSKYMRCVHFYCCHCRCYGDSPEVNEHSFQWSWNRFANAGKSSIFCIAHAQSPRNCISSPFFPFAVFPEILTSNREQRQQHRRIVPTFTCVLYLCLLWNFNFAWDRHSANAFDSIRCDSIQFFTFYLCRSSWFIDGLCKLKEEEKSRQRKTPMFNGCKS